MATDLERLLISIEASQSKLSKQMAKMAGDSKRSLGQIDKAVDNTQKRLNNLGKGINTGLGSGLKSSLGGILAGFAGNATFQGIERSVAALAKIGDVADRVGVTTVQLQELRYVVEQNGGDADTADAAIQRFAKGLGEASAKSGELYKALKANNVAIRDQHGNVRPVMDVFMDYVRVIQNARTESEQLTLSAKGFGREGGAAMVQTAQKGAEAFRQTADEAHKLGAIISNDVIGPTRELDDKITALKTSIAGIGTALAAEFGGPLLEAAMREFLSFLKETQYYLNLIRNVKFNAAGNLDLNRLVAAPGSMQSATNRLGVGLASGQRSATEQQLDLYYSAIGKPNPVSSFSSPATTTVKPPMRPSVVPSSGSGAPKGPDEYEREVDALNEKIKLLEIEGRTYGQTAAAIAQAQTKQELLNAAEDAGKKITPQLTAEMDRLAQKMGDVVAANEAAKRAIDAMNEAQKAFADLGVSAIDSLIVQGESLNQVLSNTLKSLASLVLQAGLAGTGPLAGLFGTASATGGAGGIFGALFAGARESGGPVSSGRGYLVGERGPELFVPKMSGDIIPNVSSRGGGTVINMPISINAPGADPAQLQRVTEEVVRMKREMPGKVMETMNRARKSRIAS